MEFKKSAHEAAKEHDIQYLEDSGFVRFVCIILIEVLNITFNNVRHVIWYGVYDKPNVQLITDDVVLNIVSTDKRKCVAHANKLRKVAGYHPWSEAFS